MTVGFEVEMEDNSSVMSKFNSLMDGADEKLAMGEGGANLFRIQRKVCSVCVVVRCAEREASEERGHQTS